MLSIMFFFKKVVDQRIKLLIVYHRRILLKVNRPLTAIGL
jgi:hypothetical protein